MSLAPGARLGPYEILSLLGAGGMGEVYRARDTHLKRDVAIKVLPDAFSQDPERLVRFQREAELLATLNHPNIGAVYGLAQTDPSIVSAKTVQAIVLELVEGETLADVIARGPIAIDDALLIARQIADALEAAHARGVIHRDLKPANIKVTADGKVKVLDFGLAKTMDAGVSASSLSMSPTLSVHATHAGVILGTAAYMSPEQARGKPVDRRGDIWAFGCVLFEMLAGRQVFEIGETVSDAVAAILTREPEWSALPSDTPDRIRLLLRRCLQKDPHKRLRDAGDAGLEIDESLTETAAQAATATAFGEPPRSIWRRAVPAIVAALATSLLVGAAVWTLKPSSPMRVTRFVFTLPEGQRFTTTNRQIVAVSPDGTQMAYVANNSLNLKSMSGMTSTVVKGTENSTGIAFPVFSPDGEWIAYWTLGDFSLRRIALAGGAPVTIGRTDTFLFLGLSWDQSGLVYGQGNKGIMRVSANGGTPEVLVSVKEGEVAHGPQILPDGDTLLFTLARGSASDRWDKAQIVAQSLKSGERKTLLDGGSDARFLPTGHLVYALGGTLFAMPFDLGRLEVLGAANPILEGVRRSLGGVTGSAQFATSNTGSLVYVPGPASTSAAQNLALIDRKGIAAALKLPSGLQYEHPRVSPDGKRIAFGTDDGKEAIVWIYDLAGTSAMRRLTFGGRNRFPVWSADGQRVAFQSDREGDLGIFSQRADGTGTAERLTRTEPGTSHVPESWSKADVLSFSVMKGSADVSLATLSLADKKVTPVEGVRSSAVLNSSFSPDGKWMAYALTATPGGSQGVHIQPFPGTGARYQIDARGIYPVWSRDGRELFYTPPGQLIAVDIRTQPSFEAGRPTLLPREFLVAGTGTSTTYDVAPDGRFVGVIDDSVAQAGSPAVPQIHVVLNWFEELKARMPLRSGR